MLLDSTTGNATAQFGYVLGKIFERFDVDGDGLLNEEELKAFSVCCNGEPFDEDTLLEMRENFVVSEDGSLTLEGFVQMYLLQTSSESTETWKDLKKLGYSREDIKNIKPSFKMLVDNIQEETFQKLKLHIDNIVSKNLLPPYKSITYDNQCIHCELLQFEDEKMYTKRQPLLLLPLNKS
uniref:EF-hand domain-containing protein n=1 Tax=Arcella intermedia TaxID=1963864 RepID=A0A6B2LKI2_9EUKA